MLIDGRPATNDQVDFETLIGLVERYSPSGEEAEAVRWLVGRFGELGYTQSFVDEIGNAVGVMGQGPRQIVLLGHIDTVPGEIEVCLSSSPAINVSESNTPASLVSIRPASVECEMYRNQPDTQPADSAQPETKINVIANPAGVKQSAPHSGRLPRSARNDVLYGRGSVDAKGPLAAFIDAVAAIGPVEGWQLVVIGAIDEERDSVGARHIVNLYQPEFAIIGEPSSWDRVTLGYKGSAWAEVRVRQSMAHTAGNSASAPEMAVQLWNQITAWAADFNAGRTRLFDQITPTLRGFSSSEDGFAGTASLQIGVRLPEGFDPPQWYEKLQGWAAAARAEFSPKGFAIPAYRTERTSPLVRAFLGGIRTAGSQPGFVVKTGTADLNIVAPVWGCPAVAYGPGDSSLDHTPNEHISLEEYRRAVGVLQAVLSRLTA